MSFYAEADINRILGNTEGKISFFNTPSSLDTEEM